MDLKYLDGLMGFVVGDTMGFPLENMNREDLLRKPVTKMLNRDDLPIGTWSNNTSLMIATVDSINAKSDIDLEDMFLKYIAYKEHANYTPFNEVYGIDRITGLAIDKYAEQRSEPENCGISDTNDSKVLVRLLPLAYYAVEKKLQDFEVLDLVTKVCKLTHANEECIMAGYFYVRFVMFLLNGKDKYSAYSMTKCVDYTMFKDNDRFNRLLKDDINKYKINDINSNNEIVNTLEACIWLLLQSENYKEVVIGAINLGDNTSTIAALTGALAGIVYGYELIPEEWLNNIARKDYLLDIFEEFSENKYE